MKQEPDTEQESGIRPEEIAGAERVAGLNYTAEERAMLAETLEGQIARFERRRAQALTNDDAPACTFAPLDLDAAPPLAAGPAPHPDQEEDPHAAVPERPQDPGDLAFAPAWHQAAWLRAGTLTSTELTEVCLERIARLDAKLHACITVTADRARRQAARADEEIAAGRIRGPLHGLPWGAKDLFDTAGIPTTWGAEPYRNRIPGRDAEAVRRLDEAGAVLVAKTSLGALAYGDRWFGGRTRNPWNLERGSSGSSAGSAAGAASGLFSFALGTETYGSIVSPCMRCGATGLRPTFGRVARTGAMALCWSLDKIGPITRSVRDAGLVLDALSGAHPGDPSSRALAPVRRDPRPPSGMRVGIRAEWFEGEQRGMGEIFRGALEALRALGAEIVEVDLPEGPYDPLLTVLHAEAAAAFEELTLSDRDDLLSWQAPQAWPNSFRAAWLMPAVELVQADRLRRRLAAEYAAAVAGVDALFSPSYAGGLLLLTNFTGHPCLTLRAGFREGGQPVGMTLWGRQQGEGTLWRLGEALEERLGVSGLRPEF